MRLSSTTVNTRYGNQRKMVVVMETTEEDCIVIVVAGNDDDSTKMEEVEGSGPSVVRVESIKVNVNRKEEEEGPDFKLTSEDDDARETEVI